MSISQSLRIDLASAMPLERIFQKHIIGLEFPKKVELNQREQRYFAYAREAVNQEAAREFRGDFLAELIKSARIDK